MRFGDAPVFNSQRKLRNKSTIPNLQTIGRVGTV